MLVNTRKNTGVRMRHAGAFLLLLPMQERGVLVVHQQIQQCGSQLCWCFCNLIASAATRGAGVFVL